LVLALIWFLVAVWTGRGRPILWRIASAAAWFAAWGVVASFAGLWLYVSDPNLIGPVELGASGALAIGGYILSLLLLHKVFWANRGHV
jgi:hypothetical protein